MHRYAIFGHPIGHTLSPQIHQKFAHQTHQIIDYQAIDVVPEHFEKTVMEFFQAGGMGANITVPYKEKVMSLCDVLSFEARKSGAVNTLMRQPDGAIFGHNTDGDGLLNHLLSEQVPLKGSSVLLLGAGGAAKGVLATLLSHSVSSVCLMNRTFSKAQAIQSLYAQESRLTIQPWGKVTQKFDLIINATSASLHDEPLNLASTLVDDSTICYDMMYGKETTRFHEWARHLGAKKVFDGLGMLVYQAALGFELWRQVSPNITPVYAEIRDQRR